MIASQLELDRIEPALVGGRNLVYLALFSPLNFSGHKDMVMGEEVIPENQPNETAI